MCKCSPMLDGAEAWHRVFVVHYWDNAAGDAREDVSGTETDARAAFERIVAEGHSNIVFNERMYRRIDCCFASFQSDEQSIAVVFHEIAVLEGFRFSIATPMLTKRRTMLVSRGAARVRLALPDMQWMSIKDMRTQDVPTLSRLLQDNHKELVAKSQAVMVRERAKLTLVPTDDPSR